MSQSPVRYAAQNTASKDLELLIKNSHNSQPGLKKVKSIELPSPQIVEDKIDKAAALCNVLDLPGIVAVLKPPGWEVDARTTGHHQGGEAGGTPLRLSAFLRWQFAKEEFPLVHSPEQQFGIIHRLDVPSSGLILVGKNFEGYYMLRWQLDTYELGREYLVLAHGRMAWGTRVISARIKTMTTAESVRSVACEEGRPAWTQVEPLVALERAHGESYTLVYIRIRTGRTHQIRVHLQHVGHPSVTDGKYTDAAVYSRDLQWCPRNFLHRHRLTFVDTDGSPQEAIAPLPNDLVSVLRAMSPVDARSSKVLDDILRGKVHNAGLA